MSKEDNRKYELHQELPDEHPEAAIRIMHTLIRISVKLMAGLMVLVIMWGVADVVYVIYHNLMRPPFFMLNVSDIFQVFGAFMVVLIAVEIFVNIRLYLGSNVVPVRLVIATALMAIARKVIVLDITKVSHEYVLAIAAVVMALGIAYWLVGHTQAVDH